MPSDRSRPPDHPSDAYTGVVMQQGRVLLDRDFNAERDILDDRDRLTTCDVVGPCGTPDNGFEISRILELKPIVGGLVKPIGQFVFQPSPPSINYDLRIGPGTMYIGGLRVEFPADPGGVATTYSYLDQPDWLSPDPPPASQTEIVWLQLDEQEISATEDPDLLEVALGGPDTTQRLRLLRTVRRASVGPTTCAMAWEALLKGWAAQGIHFEGKRKMRLPTARMKVAFTQPATSSNACDPVAAGGYLYSENQLIRMKWVPPAAGATQGTLLWGYDDASFIYRVSLDPTGQQLALTRQPPDAYHFPGQGQYVEVLRTIALLGSVGDASAQDGSGTIPRCIAEDTGFVTTLATSYDPTTSANTLVLSASVPPAYATAAASEPLFVRIWQGGQAMGPQGGTIDLVDPVTNSANGVTATITGTIAPGAFWMMALRPGTPQAVWPADLLTSPQPPNGPRSWACPLAVVEWPANSEEPTIQDCRHKFDNLVELTARPKGCCTVSVSATDLTTDRTLQSVVNGMTVPGTLCLAPGVYSLQAPLRLGAAQGGLTIVANDGATLSAAAGFEPEFGDGLVVVAGAVGVTLRGLTLVPPAAAAPSGLLADLTDLNRIALPAMAQRLKSLLGLLAERFGKVPLQTMIGVRAAGCPALTIEDSAVTFAAPAGAVAAPLFAFGLLASGACAQLAVRGCRFDATGLPPTQTPGLWQTGGFLVEQSFTTNDGGGIAIQGAVGILAGPCATRFLNPQATPAGGLSLRDVAVTSGKVIVENGAVNVITDPAAFVGNPQDVFTTIPDFTGAVIEDNVFSSVMLGVSAFGMLDGVRVVDNTVTGSSAGIWLRPIEQARFGFTTTTVDGPTVAGDTMWLKLVLLQREVFFSWLLGLLLPLPAGALQGKFTATTGGATLRVTGNAVSTLFATSSSASAGIPALAIVTGTFTSAVDVGPGFTVAENRFQARTMQACPGSVLALSGRLALTGNLMSNESIGIQPTGAPAVGVALAIYPNNNNGQTQNIQAPRICVTGNVLEGSSNLALLLRTDAGTLPAPFNTWVPFNASA